MNVSVKVVKILSPEELRRTLRRLASEIVERTRDLSQLVLLGIYTRGVPLANLLASQIEGLENVNVAVGALDITFYRDDLDLPQNGAHERLVAYLRQNFMRKRGLCNPIFGMIRTASLRETRQIGRAHV